MPTFNSETFLEINRPETKGETKKFFLKVKARLSFKTFTLTDEIPNLIV